MVIDVSRCTGCYNCFLACRDEHVGVAHLPYTEAQPESGHRWMDIKDQEFGGAPRLKVTHTPVPCLQCEKAPCVTAGKGAITRRPDGIVIIDPVKAVGRKELVSSCPYRAIYWNEAENVAQKCTFCAHLLDKGWKQPRCVEVCPTQALVFGDLDDPTSPVAQETALSPGVELRPALEARARVRFRGLPVPFLAGEVVLADRTGEPAVGVRVELVDGAGSRDTRTDEYGEFMLAGIERERAYRVRVSFTGYATRELEVAARAPTDLGTVQLERA